MIAVTNDTIANVLNIAIIPSFSTNIWIYPFNLAAANEANSHTPNNSDRYFFGACLLMNEFPSGEKQISDIVSNVPNRNNHSTEALTVSGESTPLITSIAINARYAAPKNTNAIVTFWNIERSPCGL